MAKNYTRDFGGGRAINVMNWLIRVSQRQGIFLVAPEVYHNNPGLQIISSDPVQIKRFKELCWSRFKAHRPFLQSDAADFVYFEFWGSGKDDEIISIAQSIAEEIGLPLDGPV